jgi:hypothetical protein
MSQNIVIRVIRKESKPKHDDVITVSRTYCNGTLKMKYKDSKNDSTFLTTLSEAGFLKYLDTLFTMLEFDDDPFSSIQFSFPQYPCILFTLDTVSRYAVQETVKDVARVTFEAWKSNTTHEMWDYEDA